MKILFSDNTLWGLLNFRMGVIMHLMEQGNEIVLVAPEDDLCDISQIPSTVKYFPILLSRTGTNPLKDFKYYNQLKKIYKQEKPDYIFHYTIKPNIYGTYAAKSLKIPSSMMIAGLGHIFNKNTLSSFVAQTMYKFAICYSKKILVLNRENYEKLLKYNFVKKKKIVLLEGGEGVNVDQFVPSVKNDNKIVFIMICRILYEKGYKEYIGAATALRSLAEFHLMGPIDSHPTAVKRETIDADVAAGIIKYIDYSPDVISQIAHSDCIVLPSYNEGLSRVLMEGLAMGKPLITTDIAGCRETVMEGVNGFICEPRSIESLTEACRKFLNLSKMSRNQMGNQSRKLAMNTFDEKIVFSKYDAILRGSIGKK